MKKFDKCLCFNSSNKWKMSIYMIVFSLFLVELWKSKAHELGKFQKSMHRKYKIETTMPYCCNQFDQMQIVLYNISVIRNCVENRTKIQIANNSGREQPQNKFKSAQFQSIEMRTPKKWIGVNIANTVETSV